MNGYENKIVTIERYLLDRQPEHARGDFTALMYDIALAAKLIAYKTNRAGLQDILGRVGSNNVQGEEQQKLDIFADDILFRLCDHTGRLCAMASEEHEEILEIPPEYEKGKYVLVFDPLDGSSNIDVNVSVGTVFGIYRHTDYRLRGRIEDFLQRPRNLLAAGYVLYGSSTMLVYSAGNGVHGFTLDLEIGEFLLSHPNMRFPDAPKYYSANHAYYKRWHPEMQEYLDWLQGDESPPLSERYIGSLVADFHRNLLKGGIFMYPAEVEKPNGKIRLLYEAGPLAYLAHHAGGYASNGQRSILDIEPESLHQRVPFFVGNEGLVRQAEMMLSERVPA